MQAAATALEERVTTMEAWVDRLEARFVELADRLEARFAELAEQVDRARGPIGR